MTLVQLFIMTATILGQIVFNWLSLTLIGER